MLRSGRLNLPALTIRLVPVTAQNRIPLVQNSTVDLECGSTTNHATRQKDVAFAPTLYVEEIRTAVKAASGTTRISQLAGKTLVTTTGTTSVQTLREPIATMMRRDDPAFKKAVDDSVKSMLQSGEVAKLYDKWLQQPIPPTNTRVGLPLSEASKAAWANPNDKPMEEYRQQ